MTYPVPRGPLHTFLGILLTVAAARPGFAQAAAQPARGFDAVSIQPAAANVHAFGKIEDPVRLRYPSATLLKLIMDAYGLSPWRISGGAGWVRRERFALEAETAKPADRAAMMLMLRRVLGARFGLKLDRIPRQGAVYDLKIAKGGTKLGAKMAGPAAPRIRMRLADGSVPPMVTLCYLPGGAAGTDVRCSLVGYQATMAELVRTLDGLLQAPVRDATGLTGKYNFNAQVRGFSGSRRAAMAMLPHAVEQQLGVKLVKSRGSYFVYEIAAAHRPTGN